MNYTLIAYKPNSDDYCRGCHMASYSSDFDTFYTTSEEELLDKWFDIRKTDRKLETGEAGYEITVLFNGKSPDDGYEEYEESIRLREIIDKRYEQWSKEQDEEDAREKLRKEHEAKKREREDDLRQLKQLQKKLGVKNDR